ncbi:MAG: L,D-transpeptidase family protein [Rhizobiaceae bacterium]
MGLLRVRKAPGVKTRGLLIVNGRTVRCALGRSGIGICKREGDGKTPRGRFALLSAMLRSDKVSLRNLRFQWKSITGTDGWCDAVRHPRYNQAIDLPFAASHEKLKRNDHLYDMVVVIDHNVTQHLGVGGSAIFFHLTNNGYHPTEGCIAISRRDMEWLLPRIGPQTIMIVE